MNARLARQTLRAYRPSGEDDHDRAVRTALKFTEKNAAIAAEFQNQLAFDRAMAKRLGEIPLPAEVAAPLEEVARRLEARRCRRFTLRDPAMLAVGVAFLCLIGLITWIGLGKMGSFAGMQEIAEMVGEAAAVGPDRFTEIETTADNLQDWFVMQDFEGFVVPPELAKAPVLGARMFKYENIPVAAAVVTRPRALIYVLEARPLGLSLPEGKWRTAAYGTGDKRAFAVRQIGAMAVVLTLLDGGRPELEAYLATLEAGQP